MTATSRRPPIGECVAGDELGFTLLELLVALAILAAGLTLVLAAFTGALDRNRDQEAQVEAQSLESALLAQALTRPDVQFGALEGQKGQFHWRVEYSPYGTDEDEAAWNARAAKITINVSWQRGETVRKIAVNSLRVLPKASP